MYKLIGVIIFFIGLGMAVTTYRSCSVKEKDKQECGKALQILKEDRQHKDRYSHTDYYVLTRFDRGITKAVKVNMETYLTVKENQKVCFQMSERDFEGNAPNWSAAISLILLIAGFIIWGLAKIDEE